MKTKVEQMLESYILSIIFHLDYRAFEMILLRKHLVPSRLGNLTPKRVQFTNLLSNGSVHSFHYHKCIVNDF